MTLEPLDKRHKFKWRVGLVLSGVMVSSLTYWQQARQRVRADSDARAFREHAVLEERNNTDKFNALTEKFNLFVAQISRPPKVVAAPKVPTAEEIASAVGQKLKDIQPAPSTAPDKNTATATNVVPAAVVPLVIQPPTAQPCRGDRLSQCSVDQLLEWGKPLVANIDAVESDYMVDLKKLDYVKSGNWFGELIGIGDKNSKWLKAHALAEEKAADRFRDCCAESALVYHKELAQRTAGGLQNTDAYEWVQNLVKPVRSKEWKKARQDGGNVISVRGDLESLQLELKIRSRHP